MPANRGTGARVSYKADREAWSASVTDPNCGLIDARSGSGSGDAESSRRAAADAAMELAAAYGVGRNRVAEVGAEGAFGPNE